MDFFNQLFAELSHEDSIAILIFLLVSFILGYLAGYFAGRSGQRKLRRELNDKSKRIQALEAEVLAVQQHVEESKTSIDRLTTERDDMRQVLDNMERERNSLIVERQAALDQLKQAQNRKNAYEKTIAELNETINKLRQGIVIQDDEPYGDGQSSADLAQRVQMLEDSMKILSRQQGENIGDLADGDVQTSIASLEAQLEQQFEQRFEKRIKALEERLQAAGSAPVESEFVSVSKEAEGIMKKAPYDAQPKNALITERAKEGRIDKLTQISGVGEKLQQQLYQIGIFSFDQIADWGEEDIERITFELKYIPGRIHADDWVGQAKLLSNSRDEQSLMFVTEYKDPNDLSIFEGVDDTAAAILREAGVYSWRDLADTDAQYLENVLNDAAAPTDQYDPESWPAQARLASDGMWEELEELKQRLR